MRFMRYNLWKAKRRLDPEAAFRRALLKKLDTAWGKQYGAVAWYKLRLARLASAGTIGVLVAGSFGTGAYAYTSPGITEMSVLYPVKQTIERVEEKIKLKPEAKAKFYVKQLERREAERRVLVARATVAAKTELRIANLEEKLEATQELLATTTLQNNPRLAVKIEEHLSKRRQRLEEQMVKLAMRNEERAARVAKIEERKETRMNKKEERLVEKQQTFQVKLDMAVSSGVAGSSTERKDDVSAKAARITDRQKERLEKQLANVTKQLTRLRVVDVISSSTVTTSPKNKKQIAPSVTSTIKIEAQNEAESENNKEEARPLRIKNARFKLLPDRPQLQEDRDL